MACRVWHETKINYVFIFEYDTRHYLDWRQLSEVSVLLLSSLLEVDANMSQLPCWCFFMLGLFMQINFHQVGGESIYLYYPVMLLSISVALLFNPIKIFYFRTRMWLLYSLVSLVPLVCQIITNFTQWRLLLAGIYPVEWRDFYMGDMFCSLTYSMAVSCASHQLVFKLTIS